MNPARLSFILSFILPPPKTVGKFPVINSHPLKKERLKWLEVGPGGGILITSLLSLGLPPSSVTAVEPSLELCTVLSNRHPSVQIRNGYVEDVVEEEEVFDVVTMLEVIEHIPPSSRPMIFSRLVNSLKEGGLMVVSTIDRSIMKGFLKGILGAEYFSKVVEKGTHRWDYFVKLNELEEIVGEDMKKIGIGVMEVKGGIKEEILTYGFKGKGGEWTVREGREGEDCGNYIIAFRKGEKGL